MLGVARLAGMAAALLIVCLAVGGSAVCGTISVGWNAVDHPTVAGYRVHVGSESGQYDRSISVGNVTDTTLTGIDDCQSHYLAVKAVSYTGVESLVYSNEVSGWPRPEIGSVSHPLVHPGTALQITLEGTNFAPGASVSVVGGDVTVSGVTVDSCNVARVSLWLAPGASLGPRQIEWTNPDGAFGTYAGLFAVCGDDDGDGAFSAECGGDDCDDSSGMSSPGGLELCDGLDNDCDGSVDEGGVCSGDPDGDGVGGAIDNCADVPNPDQADSDVDGWGDACDPCTDVDSDGFGDPVVPANQCSADNCPGIPNPSQSDVDGNGVGNACELAHGATTLLSYWSLDALEGEDTLPDATGSGHDLRVEGASVSDGVMSGALELVGQQNHYAILENPAGLELPQSFSLTAWVRPNSLGQNASGAIIDKLDGLNGYSLRLNGDAGLTLYGLRAFGAIYSDPGVVPPGWWHHVAVTSANGYVRFYVNGMPVGVSTATRNSVSTDAPLCLGNSADLSRDFDGLLDDIRVYSGALDPVSISNLMLTTVAYCVDSDGDGFGAPASPGCVAGLASDCDDSSAATYPYATEICGDGIDQNCSGGDLACACGDIDGDGFIDAACGGADCNDGDGQTYPGAMDTCGDGVDQDCDGMDAVCTCGDNDGDGFTDAACGGADCDDGDGEAYPGATETCGDGVDQDCDGFDAECTCWDFDGDGFTDTACGGSDCNDGDAETYPGVTETCGDGVDQDCDGFDAECTCWDYDGDGAQDWFCGGADCDDGNPGAYPDALEICGDGIDQDCDGADANCDCPDEDGDGAADLVCGGTDCDDYDPTVRPGAEESCNGIDDDCDGAIDENDVCSAIPVDVAHFTMDADTLIGVILADVTGNGHDGLVIGAQPADGYIGGSLEWLQGEQDTVVIPDDDALDLGAAFTIAAWIHPETFGESYSGAILDKFNVPAADGYAFRLSNEGGHSGLVFYGANEQSFYFSQSDVVELREWQHVALTYADGTLAFWVNGVAAGQRETLHDPRPSSKPVVLGNNQAGTRDFDGRIDELRLYDVALTPAQLQELVGQ